MRFRATIVLIVATGATLAGAASAMTRAQCPSSPLCRIVDDADSDGEISDDLRQARNELLYASGAGPADTVYLYPPEPGTYEWNGQVRFCGDDTPPSGQAEPDCDGTSDLPVIQFAGAWWSVFLEASCAEDSTPGGISACLRIGDRFAGAGAGEPRARVLTEQPLRFRHTFLFGIENWLLELWHPVFAVWLDGITQSTVFTEVGRDIPGWSYSTGSGVYVSATNSLVATTLLAESAATLFGGVVADGDMSGSLVVAVADLSQAPSGMNTVVSVGAAQDGYLGLTPYGPGDGCQYGPDPPQSCSDFQIDVSLSTPQNSLGGDGVEIIDGDDIQLHLNASYLTAGHHLVKIPGLASTPGSVGDVTITGQATFAGVTEALEPTPLGAISAAPEATALVDLPLTSLVSENWVCVQGGGIVLGPNYSCSGTP